MTFEEYQKEAKKTAIYPNIGNNITYPLLGLCGEVGEVANDYKKIIRDKNNELSEQDKQNLKKELGDVLWYLATISSELGVTLEDVAQTNIEKLHSRMDRGKLSGDGDDR